MSTTTAAAIAREHGITAPLVGYVAPVDDGKTITAPDDHPHGVYAADDLVEPFDMCNAHLRIASTYRTPGGRLSAEAQRAAKELGRRKGNAPVKKARKNLVLSALVEAGLLD